MLERCFKTPLTLHRLRGGPAGPFLDGFAESMCAEGYSSETSGCYLHAADHLGRWAARRGVAIADLDEDLLARFVRHLPRCRCRGGKRGGHKRVPFRVHAFLRYLREAGVVTTSAPEATRPPLVTEYGAWMRDRRGLAVTTMAHALPMVQALLGPVGNDPTRLDAAGVRPLLLLAVERAHDPRRPESRDRRVLEHLVGHGAEVGAGVDGLGVVELLAQRGDCTAASGR
jgi:hypothetical protein